MTWFLTVLSDRWHALTGVPWAGMASAMCGRSFHLEDIEVERDHVEAGRACRRCLLAVAEEQER